MTNPLRKYSETLFALLRIVAGLLFACHGAQKLFGVIGGERATAPLMMVAGVIEFGGGLLIAVGLLGSIAAFLASGEMAYAYFSVHAPQSPWPIVSHGELPALYAFLFIFIAAHGAGRLSVEALLAKRGKSAARGPASP
ncbi:MAG TPA: DoxX family protein [Candidatus Eisenbacteria bacterium]|nr:DoxX family protein [Candidatus Eisenbacteria bacterium]